MTLETSRHGSVRANIMYDCPTCSRDTGQCHVEEMLYVSQIALLQGQAFCKINSWKSVYLVAAFGAGDKNTESIDCFFPLIVWKPQ